MQKIPAAPKCTAPKLTAKAMPKLLLGFLPILLSACAYPPAGTVANATTQSSKQPSSEQIYWVSGHKMPCSAGAGKMMCLRGSKHPEFHQASWQYFYAPIEGFVFEAGVAKKIKVHAT